MQERVVIVPDQDNDGQSLASERESIENALLGVAGGFTSDRVSGAWRGDDGTVYRDYSTRYTVAVDPETDARIVALLPLWCELLRQQCLYTAARVVEVAFVSPAVLTSESVASH